MIQGQEGYKKYLDYTRTIGGLALHSLFPKDFEYYMIAFELCDGETNQVIDFLSFPVLPKSLSLEEIPINNVKKTFGGVTAITSNQFNPIPISMQGDFGKGFKVLLKNNEDVTFMGIGYSVDSGNFNRNYYWNDIKTKITNKIFNPYIKTGYGCIKILEAILNKSSGLNKNGVVNKLVFYNLAFGESYIVKLVHQKYSQSVSGSNMIWGYDIQIKAVCPIEYDIFKSVDENGQIIPNYPLIFGALQGSVNTLCKDITSYITKL